MREMKTLTFEDITYEVVDEKARSDIENMPITKGTGEASAILGNKTTNTSSGKNSLTAGNSNVASADNTMAFGEKCQSTGVRSISLGSSAKATNNNAVAINCETQANGKHSLAGGYRSKANADRSMALGEGVETNTIGEFVCGRYNVADTGGEDMLFVVGNGTSDSDRSNAMAVYPDGSASFGNSINVENYVGGRSGEFEYTNITNKATIKNAVITGSLAVYDLAGKFCYIAVKSDGTLEVQYPSSPLM